MDFSIDACRKPGELFLQTCIKSVLLVGSNIPKNERWLKTFIYFFFFYSIVYRAYSRHTYHIKRVGFELLIIPYLMLILLELVYMLNICFYDSTDQQILGTRIVRSAKKARKEKSMFKFIM